MNNKRKYLQRGKKNVLKYTTVSPYLLEYHIHTILMLGLQQLPIWHGNINVSSSLVSITPHCDGDDGNSDIDGFDEFDTSNIT